MISRRSGLAGRQPSSRRALSLDATVTAASPGRRGATLTGTGRPVTARVRAEFLPKEATDPDRIAGIDEIMPDAVKLKYIPAPLTQSQLKELIQVPLQ